MIPVQSTCLEASAAVKTGPGFVTAVILCAESTGAEVTLYDHTAASGTKLLVLRSLNGEAAIACFGETPIVFSNCYADLDGTGATVTVAFG